MMTTLTSILNVLECHYLFKILFIICTTMYNSPYYIQYKIFIKILVVYLENR